MNLTPYVEELRHQLLVAAEPAGDEARELADRLTAALDPAARLVLLDALSAAADELTRELAPGSVELRLRAREPELVVNGVRPATQDPMTSSDDVTRRATGAVATETVADPPAPTTDADDTATARLTVRMPERLKAQIEEAAGRDGLSVNSWLVRTVGAAVSGTAATAPGSTTSPGSSDPSWSGQRYTGWARA